MNTISAISFYDALNRLTVGVLLLLPFVSLESSELLESSVSLQSSESLESLEALEVSYTCDIYKSPLFYIAAFFIGSLYRDIVCEIPNFIKKCCILTKRSKELAAIVKFFIGVGKCYIIRKVGKCCIIRKIVDIVSKPISCCVNDMYLIEHAYRDMMRKLNQTPVYKKKEDYLLAYYKVVKAGLLMNIPILEALENFFRNMFFILLLYSVLLWASCCNVVYLLSIFGSSCWWVMLLLALADVWLWGKTQEKIHYLIWEGDYYLSQIGHEKKLICTVS